MATHTLIHFLEQMGVDPQPRNVARLKRLIAEAQLTERKRCIAYVEHCKQSFARVPSLPQNIEKAADAIRDGLLKI